MESFISVSLTIIFIVIIVIITKNRKKKLKKNSQPVIVNKIKIPQLNDFEEILKNLEEKKEIHVQKHEHNLHDKDLEHNKHDDEHKKSKNNSDIQKEDEFNLTSTILSSAISDRKKLH